MEGGCGCSPFLRLRNFDCVPPSASDTAGRNSIDKTYLLTANKPSRYVCPSTRGCDSSSLPERRGSMTLNRFSVIAGEVEARIRVRLLGGAPAAQSAVAWGDGRGNVQLHIASLKVVIKDGWLLCNLDANMPSDLKPLTLQFVFFLGRESDGDGVCAASAINAPDAAELCVAWGGVIQQVIWDGVLDVIEGVINHVGAQNPNHALTLLGYFSTEGQIHVEVQVADAA